ncbi:hypothetical protein ACHAWO_005803 [Cyclotella atomus]|uniref:Uncharacterized protein n=1 Tax=Cyclotella atomus TaxID=382360 RepID=A0ABD3P0L4_9STRA
MCYKIRLYRGMNCDRPEYQSLRSSRTGRLSTEIDTLAERSLSLFVYWENEMRYEILHARSLLTKDANAAAGVSSRIDPSVDSGSQILSFAWLAEAQIDAVELAAGAVHVIFLGNLEDNDIVCEMDVFTLATNKVPFTRTENPDGVCPQPAVTSLMQPHVLAYHCGGLLVSTSSGFKTAANVSSNLRIGTLLGANLVEKAGKWIYAIPSSDHDVMAQFLIRRGRPDLAISDLDGLSVERYIDLCMLYDRADELEYLVVKEGPALSKLATAKKWTEYALNSGINEVISDAMKLALYISAADRAEGQELIRKASDAMKLDSSGQLAVLGTTAN